MLRIDTHAHVFSKHDTCIPTARYFPQYDASVNTYICLLDRHAIQYGVLVQPSFFGTNNQVMLNAIRQYPQRLKGIAVLDHSASLAQLIELKEQGIIGIRANLFGLSCPDFSTQPWQNFLHHLEDLNLQLELHAPPSYLIKILPTLEAYEKLTVVIDHFGRVDPVLGIDDPDYQTFLALLKPEQHWIKISAFYRLGDPSHHIATAQQAFNQLEAKGLIHKLVWGSDWPHTQHESQVDYESTFKVFQQIVSDPKDQALILGENARNLYSFSY